MTIEICPYSKKPALALMTDLYELTMAHGYWKAGLEHTQAVFYMFFRKKPFQGGFAIAAGLEAVVRVLENFYFDSTDLDYLRSLVGVDGKALLAPEFIEYLSQLKLVCDVEAVPEGTVVFPYEPLIRVQGPLIQCQLLESFLLNLINFPTLIATKAARVCHAAQDDVVLEFGLRRAQGVDGALTASRSAFIGGCHATSNVLAGKMFGIPVKGTIAHSWVQTFDDEREAFQTYAETSPNNCVLLVDTFNTIEGVKKAIETGRWLREQGHALAGIRLDSGDLAYLSIVARKMLDDAGLCEVQIVASNELDEKIISELKSQGAKISIWGVGTNLVTAKDHPALDGVYKLSAIRHAGGEWQHKLKLSEQMIKVSNPGILQVRRFRNTQENVADVVYEVNTDCSRGCTAVDPLDATRKKVLKGDLDSKDLLVPIFRKGKCVYELPSLPDIRKNTKSSLAGFHSGIKRFLNPHEYVVGMEHSLYIHKIRIIERIRSRESLLQNSSSADF